MSCGTCAKMRSYFPESIRRNLEIVEQRIEAKKRAAKKPQVAFSYVSHPSTCKPCADAANKR